MLTKFAKILIALILGANIAFAAPASNIDAYAIKHSVPHFASVPNGMIEYYDFGSGTPIVMISGYGSTVSSWDWHFIAALASQHRVIIFDNRNTGNTMIHAASYTSKDLANDTYTLIKQLNLNKPVILGISMGGMIAQQYAVLHPDAMSKLILINTAIAGTSSVPPSLKVQQMLFAPTHGAISLYIRALKLFFPPEWQSRMALALLGDRFHSIYIKERPTPHSVILEQQNLVRTWAEDNSTEKQITRLPMPVLILNGGQDIVIPPVNSNILQHAIPHAKLLRWAQGGHSMIYQFPNQLASAISNFIGS